MRGSSGGGGPPLAGRAAVDELLLRPGLDHHHVENDIPKALNNVVDLAVGQGPSGAVMAKLGAPGRSATEILRRLRGFRPSRRAGIATAEERSRWTSSSQVNKVSGVVKIHTAAPAQANLTSYNRIAVKCLNSALCVGHTDELNEAG